ncbi:protein of unknown function [Candidatus Filomicrobium marinum]|uniref:Uncharacterized protein n=1 Tax=Candidatus Filomicrobium marinum TaxID=1608628 RepID=A0A0D6JF30_9HYPH|nr:protein of unknown function [Candidatus Filomicrobium marinum]CPR19119.1 protein of unknown function [Candidatus Filomicrobium marinum]
MAKRAMDVASQVFGPGGGSACSGSLPALCLRAQTGARLKTAAPFSKCNGFELPVTKSLRSR